MTLAVLLGRDGFILIVFKGNIAKLSYKYKIIPHSSSRWLVMWCELTDCVKNNQLIIFSLLFVSFTFFFLNHLTEHLTELISHTLTCGLTQLTKAHNSSVSEERETEPLGRSPIPCSRSAQVRAHPRSYRTAARYPPPLLSLWVDSALPREPLHTTTEWEGGEVEKWRCRVKR